MLSLYLEITQSYSDFVLKTFFLFLLYCMSHSSFHLLLHSYGKSITPTVELQGFDGDRVDHTLYLNISKANPTHSAVYYCSAQSHTVKAPHVAPRQKTISPNSCTQGEGRDSHVWEESGLVLWVEMLLTRDNRQEEHVSITVYNCFYH